MLFRFTPHHNWSLLFSVSVIIVIVTIIIIIIIIIIFFFSDVSEMGPASSG